MRDRDNGNVEKRKNTGKAYSSEYTDIRHATSLWLLLC